MTDAAYRRARLVASLVNPENGYSRLRLSHYATGDSRDWETLPEWNPAVAPIAARELDSPGAAMETLPAESALELELSGVDSAERERALLALGRQAFAQYPVQLAPYMSVALVSRAAAMRYGLWVDEARGVGGLVHARMADTSVVTALTCSSCHTAPSVGGGVEDGLPNAQLELGQAMLDADGLDPAAADAIAAWGAGRLDTTTQSGTEPVRIADLRPVRFLTHLHQDATLAASDLTTLAIRIETLIIVSSGQVVRPPRVLALALAAYVNSLADTLPSMQRAQAASVRGAQVFARECARCHVPPALTGPPVSLAIIGTDPALGLSADRGTGMYRVPSLHGVGNRGPLLHDATVPSIEALFDPVRTTSAFGARLHGTGAVPGHLYGLDLPDSDRAALVSYLDAL